MSVNETVEPPPRSRRPDRRHGRLEDFEMIERTRAALTLLDSKWSVPVIVLLASGVRRHARLMDNIPGISKKVLSATLRKLEHRGLLPATCTPRSRYESNTASRRSAGGSPSRSWPSTSGLANTKWSWRTRSTAITGLRMLCSRRARRSLPPRPRNGRRFGHENGDLPGGLLPLPRLLPWYTARAGPVCASRAFLTRS